MLPGIYSGGFDIEYPVSPGDWAIVVDAFVSRQTSVTNSWHDIVLFIRLVYNSPHCAVHAIDPRTKVKHSFLTNCCPMTPGHRWRRVCCDSLHIGFCRLQCLAATTVTGLSTPWCCPSLIKRSSSVVTSFHHSLQCAILHHVVLADVAGPR